MSATGAARGTAALVRFDDESQPVDRILLCLPHAGGTADSFRSWVPLVDDRASVWSVDYPGRRSASDSTWSSLADVADALAEECREVARVTVFGHSMGGILAYEVAARLASAGRRPERLVVSAVPSPQRRAAPQEGTAETRAEAILGQGGTDESILADAEFHAHARQLLATDLDVLDAHRPTPPPLDVPLLVLASLADRVCALGEVRDWERYSSNFLRFRYFAGSHMYPFEKPDQVVAACLA